MKQSTYNIFINEDPRFFVYNQISGGILEVNERLYTFLKENKDIKYLESNTADLLYKTGMLCPKELNEPEIIIARNREQRYGNKIVRLTILPTMDCNFKCWYCYENHVPSIMEQSTINSIVSFANKLLVENRPKQFQLDWFGGEPLLHFNDIIYPLSLKLKKICSTNNVTFFNSITSNGYLINETMVEKFKEIELCSFQITLDGEEKYHNKTRFTEKDHETYRKIINNIELLCRSINEIKMVVRINYTVQNLKTIEKIADSFNEDLRTKIVISPHVVWQHLERISNLSETIEIKMNVFRSKGYRIKDYVANPKKCIGCYTENMLQFVINYDSKVYKCTARDFSEKYSIGKLDSRGNFIPSSLFFKYYSTNSAFEREECLQCNLLPSCRQSCIQKVMEKEKYICRKKDVEAALTKKIKLMINNKQ